MSLHPLAQQFASVTAEYERGRPDYPPAAIGALAAELALRPGAGVLDLAAGTGRLSAALLDQGVEVIAVEPTGVMRERLAARIGPDRVREGLAEAIPLDDGSVQAVTVGDAFHWFDKAPALAEIRRVLRPGGGLAILNTVVDWSGASWADEVGKLAANSRPDHPHFEGPSWQEAVRDAPGWWAPREIRVTVSRPAEPERIVDLIASWSWVAGMPEAERTELLGRANELVSAGSTPVEFPLHVVIGLASLEAG